MNRTSSGRRPTRRREGERGDAPGIVIADGGLGVRAALRRPRLRAFIYGEELPASPTLPFGRWKEAS